MSKMKVETLIDTLGYAKIAKDITDQAYEEILKKVKEAIDKKGFYYGDVHALEITERAMRKVDVKAVYKRLGITKFLEVTSVLMTQLKKYIGDEEIDKLTDSITVSLVYISKTKSEKKEI